MYFKNFIEIKKKYFFDKLNYSKIRLKISQGNIYYVKNILSSNRLRNICLKILKTNKIKTLDHKILEGIENIFYISRPKKITKKNEYIANDRSWYFFPWNEDKTKLSKLVQPIFNTITKINKYDPNKIVKFTPKNGLVQRFHLIFYPKNSGEISRIRRRNCHAPREHQQRHPPLG